MNADEIILYNLCILRYRWDTELPSPIIMSNVNEYNIGYTEDLINFDVSSSRPYGSNLTDCHFDERGNNMRLAPTDCYKKEFNPNYPLTWMRFFGEIRPDLQYTFDYVLNNRIFPDRKENRLWYLMIYLKTLATLVNNPVDIVLTIKKLDTFTEDLKNLKKALEDLQRENRNLRDHWNIQNGLLVNEHPGHIPVIKKSSSNVLEVKDNSKCKNEKNGNILCEPYLLIIY